MEGVLLASYHLFIMITTAHVFYSAAREFNSKAAKAIWDLNGNVSPARSLYTQSPISEKGIYATSRHIPGVRFAGINHPGVIGTAPSAELLATWNKREGELIAAHANAVPPMALPPEPIGAYVGQPLGPEVLNKIVNEGARTIPGRENGGNCDVCQIILLINGFLLSSQIKNLSRCSSAASLFLLSYEH